MKVPQFSESKAVAVARTTEKRAKVFMGLCASVSILISVGILFSMVFESYKFFHGYSIVDFLFGLHWSPNTYGTGVETGSFGIIPLVVGTIVITIVAIAVAIPFGLGAAVYLTEFSDYRLRRVIKPILEVLAGIPTIVYGFFAVTTISPFVQILGKYLGASVSSESALAAGIAMGIMIIPFISSLVDNALTSVPNSLRLGAYALGATRMETMVYVLIPAALPGIVGAFILAFSRAIGETMIVVMAAGLMANLSLDPLDSLTTITVQIVTSLTGDQAFNDMKTLSAFALGIFLFVVTLLLNVMALRIIAKYSEKYQ